MQQHCSLKTAFVGLAKTIYVRCIYGNFGREITKYTVVYGVYIRFLPGLVTGYVLSDPGESIRSRPREKLTPLPAKQSH
jgi:hypothetical protein